MYYKVLYYIVRSILIILYLNYNTYLYYIVCMSKDIKSVPLNFRTTEEIKKFLDEQSMKYDRSISYIINDLLEYFIKNPPKSIPTDKKK